MLQSRTTIRVRFSETDMMGIVYHGSYLPWLEVGRSNLLREYGFNYRELSEKGYYLPVLDLTIKYRRPARYDDDVIIETVINERPTIRIKLEYRIFRGEELLATASTQHAFIDHAGQPTRPPADFINAIGQYFAE